MFEPAEAQFLGLSKKENKLLSWLEEEISVSKLAEISKIPRTSLYTFLTHFQKRGLVEGRQKGKRKFWRLISKPVLQEKLFSLAENHRISNISTEKEIGLIASQESEYKIYKGKNKLLEIYDTLGDLPYNTRLYGLQPNNSLYSAIKVVPSERLSKINNGIKKKKVIVEAVLQENFLDYYVSKLKTEKKPLKEVLSSYGGRLAVTTYISKEYLNFDSEIIFYGNILMIINWQELVAVVIKNKEIVGIMKEMFELIKLTGKRADQNVMVENILKR